MDPEPDGASQSVRNDGSELRGIRWQLVRLLVRYQVDEAFPLNSVNLDEAFLNVSLLRHLMFADGP